MAREGQRDSREGGRGRGRGRDRDDQGSDLTNARINTLIVRGTDGDWRRRGA